MQIEITLQPRFWLALFRRDVDILMKLSEHHYDGVCRAAGRQGGFLYGWHNVTRDQSPCGEYKIEEVPKCCGSRRDLDTVLKLCEGSRMAFRCKLISAEDGARVDALCSLILTAFETATVAIQCTQLGPVTAPSQKGSLLWTTAEGRY